MFVSSIVSLLAGAALVAADLTSSNMKNHVGILALDYEFGPVKEAYWTGYPHHRRTPFALSPDGKTAYLAYLDSSETDVHVQTLDPDTFKATGTAVTITGGKEAGGLVAHNDGFALLTNEALPSGTANAPADSTPVPVLYRYTDGKKTWKTFLGGPGVHADFGLAASPDLNGDLAYSESAGIYGAYFVVTDYTGDASGHYGDSIQYLTDDGTLKEITGASSSWGCSHNTGIAFEAADDAPFASICAEDQGAVWLNTATQTMDGVKISNENTTNGASNEPMGGMSGSYSALAQFQDSTSYIFTWVSRGAIDLTQNEWLGGDFTCATNRTVNRNVAIAMFSDKNTLVGNQASSTVGAEDGDSQVNWITTGSADTSNAHAATFDGSNALVTWEEIANPTCDFLAMGCRGTFSGSYFQQVDSTGAKVGTAFKSMDTYVAGDMVTMADGRICWPYVDMTWDLSAAVAYGGSTATTQKMSFACMSLSSASEAIASSASSTKTSSTKAATTKKTTSTKVTSSKASSTKASVTAVAESSSILSVSSSSTVVKTTKKATSTKSKTRTRKSSSSTTAASSSKVSSKKHTKTTKKVASTAAPAQTSFITRVKTTYVTAADTVSSTSTSKATSKSSATKRTKTTKVPSATKSATATKTAAAAQATGTGKSDKETIKQLYRIIEWLYKMLAQEQAEN